RADVMGLSGTGVGAVVVNLRRLLVVHAEQHFVRKLSAGLQAAGSHALLGSQAAARSGHGVETVEHPMLHALVVAYVQEVPAVLRPAISGLVPNRVRLQAAAALVGQRTQCG